jgi:very-short-patch-repair endonuclease
MRGAKDQNTLRARSLRQRSTDAETKLWNRLRARAIGGHKFVRQEPIGPYIADFVCRERRLIVEIDGGQHATDPKDATRTKWLNDHNYCVLRFWNNDVLHNIDGVLEVIANTLAAEAPPHPDR